MQDESECANVCVCVHVANAWIYTTLSAIVLAFIQLVTEVPSCACLLSHTRDFITGYLHIHAMKQSDKEIIRVPVE